MLDMTAIDNINRTIEEFFAQYDIEITARVGTEFLYLPDKKLVQYSFTTLGKQDKWFTRFIKMIDDSINADIFILSLMHEVGHHMTLEDIPDVDYDREIHIKTQLDGVKKADNFLYFGLPSEFAATTWAIDFMLQYADEVKEFWNELQTYILDFYKDNGVEIC